MTMAQRTVLIRSTPEGPIQKEWIIDEVVRPGQLIEYASSSRIQVLGEGENPAQMEIMRVVVESGTIDVTATYPAGDLVPFIEPRSGDEVYAYATHAAGGTIPFGATLVAADAGGWLMDTGGTAIGDKAVLAIALEALELDENGIGQLAVEVL